MSQGASGSAHLPSHFASTLAKAWYQTGSDFGNTGQSQRQGEFFLKPWGLVKSAFQNVRTLFPVFLLTIWLLECSRPIYFPRQGIKRVLSRETEWPERKYYQMSEDTPPHSTVPLLLVEQLTPHTSPDSPASPGIVGHPLAGEMKQELF